uniref:RNA helicase n=1 Tax=Hubei virga-like virus 13 TaxID=1923328 RepID=A0A1L3KK48_9VIRU|nr:hypothetical protein [Hubei virga-like virus 13]
MNHAKVCTACNSDSPKIIVPPLYHHIDRVYYFCDHAHPVSLVSSLEDADIVLRLVTNLDPRECFSITDCGDFLELPIALSAPTRLSEDPSVVTAMRRLVSAYFDMIGSVPSVGIVNCGLDNISVIVQFLLKYTSKIFVLEEEVSVLASGVKFNPTFRVNVDDESYMMNSMIESREYYKSVISAIVAKLEPIHREYLDLLPVMKGGQTFNKRPDYGLIDMSTGHYVVKPKTGGGPYSYAFDGKNLVDISSAVVGGHPVTANLGGSTSWLQPGVFSGLMSVCQDTKLLNSEKIFRQMNKIDLKKLQLGFKLELVEGVPGCGKTRYIIDHHEFSDSNCGHVVLTSSREAAEDLRRRVAERYRLKPDHPILLKRYRTVDSFLMHYDVRVPVEVLWVDEGLMKHFGDLIWCAVMCGCKILRIIGDRAQVPFHNRLAGVELRYHRLRVSEKRMKTTFLSTTHRCPVDVAVMLNRFGVYTSKVKSTSDVERSLSVGLLQNFTQLHSMRDRVFLTFTTLERDSLKKEGFERVFTINQFQGNQASHVVLVRDNVKNLPLFNSKNHMLVAISRHTKSFSYLTRVIDDDLYRFLSVPITQGEILECTTVRSLLGGGVIMGKTETKQFPIYKVVPRSATMVDMLKQDAKIRDFVQGNFGVGVVPYRVQTIPIDYRKVEEVTAAPYYVSDSITTLQYFYDELFPGQSTEYFEYDDKLFQQDDLYFATKEMMRLPTYEKFASARYDCLSPSLRTSCPSPVSSGLKSVLKAFYDRNGNVPELQGLVDDQAMADTMFENFVNHYIADRDLFSGFQCEPIHVNVDSIEDWLFTQAPKVKQLAFPEEVIQVFSKELNVYSMILKKLPKPKLETGAEYKFPSPQTIAHSSKDINAVFCPIVREMKKRLLSVLYPNVVLFTDISVPDFEELLTVRLPASRLKLLKFLLEADMSKYDKSQNLVALLYEIKMIRALGFPEFLIPTWIFMHVFSKLINRLAGVVFKLFYQRKSGDPMTYFGNTLFLMAVIASLLIAFLIDMIRDGRIFMLFSGDDFLALCQFLIDLAFLVEEVAVRFNLEAKVLNYRTPYFCSKFLVMTPQGRWAVIPDVPKMLTKLGRRDLVNERHVEEYRISCLDVGRNLGNSLLYPLIDDCVLDRYKNKNLVGLSSLYSALFKCFSDKKEFDRLYYRNSRHNIDDLRVFSKLNDF